ncbi:hypothetical protein [Mesorhizobium sp. B2-3-5]|uniref:hypothetical protein n=1 Tax=Mesorhizobium sp. B2-3-5 TaxID=2589958 RepID=UPI001FF035AB|nr:hypothetical protein [Mesorhizobium sp. B2-3-5]
MAFRPLRGVRQNGAVKWRGAEIYVSATLAGEPIAIEETENGEWAMRFHAHPLGFIDEKTMKLVRRSAAPPRPLGAAANSS